MNLYSITFFLSVFLFLGCRSNIEEKENNEKKEKYNWKNVQIVGGGFVDGIIFHPTEKNLRYARTDMGGAYRWCENEQRWIPLLDWVSYDNYNLVGVESIALDPNNPDMIYMACGTYTRPSVGYGAILISSDRGKTFDIVKVPIKFGGNENGRGNGERLIVDPNNSNILYLGTRRNGMWKSTDKGSSWEKLTSFPDFSDHVEENNPSKYWQGGSGINVVLINPKSGDKKNGSSDIYVTVSLLDRDNFFRSNDAGKTWESVSGSYIKNRPTQAALADDGTIYITYGSNAGPWPMNDGAVWKYNINNEEWTDITPDKPTETYKFGYASVALDASDVNTVIVTTYYRPGRLGGEEIFVSRDGGNTWNGVFNNGKKFDYSRAPYVHHTPVHWMFDIEINPFDPNHVIFTTGYGGHETYNFTDTYKGDTTIWHVMSRGIEETVALELLSPPKGAQLLTAIGDYCGFSHFDLDNPCSDGCYTNPHFSNTNGIACAELNPDIIVRVGVGSHHVNGSTNIGYSIDGANTWNPCHLAPTPESKYGHIAVSANGKTWIWTPENQKPYITRNQGDSWVQIEQLPENLRIIADRVNPSVFYGSDVYSGRLYISTDSGYSFSYKDLLLPQGNPKVGYFRGDNRGGQDRIYATPGFEGDLWFPAFDGIMHSTDMGDHFEAISTVQEIHAFGFGKAKAGMSYPAIYIVGRINGNFGIYRSDDKAQNWVKINDDQHQYGLILHITGDPKKYGRVYVGTHGRGIVYGDPF
ncbi:MAG: hypothetical protein JW717_13485 [Marinilabiliaceae bacterium]|nr:hypothetical protein [Marinilabiliaceae bacterium]